MNEPAAESPAIDRLPMIIGVTGHRDLVETEIEPLKAAVRDCLMQLRQLCPDTPLILLSSLAEGADQLVAGVALDMGIRLVAPLPMEIPEYEKDFRHDADAVPGPDTSDKFEALLKRANPRFALPLVAGNNGASISQQGPARDAQYAQAGAYIVRNSHVLLALWDGHTPEVEPVGGTAHVVRYRLDGLPPRSSANLLDVNDAGPLIHIVCSRQASPPAVGKPASIRMLMPTESGSDDSEPILGARLASTPIATGLRRLDTYNRQARALARRHPSRLRLHADDPAPSEDSLPSGPAGRLILRQYVTADRLAILFYARRRWVNRALFSIVVLAVAFVAVYEHFFAHALMLSLYLGAMALAWLIFWVAKHFDFHNKHLDYRALAEGLRVQLFWCLAGVADDVSDRYLRKQRTELEWLREALRTQVLLQQWEARCVPADEDPGRLLETIERWTLPRWVVREHKFFSDATNSNHGKTELREKLEDSLLVAGLLLAGVALAMQLKELFEHLRNKLIVLMVLAPTIAAALSGYSKQMAFVPQAKRYQWMAALFDRARQRLKEALDAKDLDAAQRLLVELGTEALSENGDWVMMHREREPEAPTAG
ncbi:hypothetical protein [Scleromatobacter humisilvae]|uniref:SMODS and SLOG-associating 2TM effector domain-containing protein n=1 Tax=Scleromatobacter humisilvae TaxID=2897159 RepID=A0A9X2C2J5_9BURK|nr:hypothetical protein [Scleromatobacter humisilvae]MCK9686105.1 hypothetical protein [Scleromatobacter humisilvae]